MIDYHQPYSPSPDPFRPSSPTDVLDIASVRDRLVSASIDDGATSQVHIVAAVDTVIGDLLSRLLTLDQCAAQFTQSRQQIQEVCHELDQARRYATELEKQIAERDVLEQYMREQIDRRNATLNEQRREFYDQLMVLKTLVGKQDQDHILHHMQLHGISLQDYRADHRPILKRMGSQISFDGDGRVEAAEWNRLLQETRAKLENRSKTFDLQVRLLKDELEGSRLEYTNQVEVSERIHRQNKEIRDQLRMVKMEKVEEAARSEMALADCMTRIKLLETRLENSVSSSSVSKAFNQGDINMRSQISALSRAHEDQLKEYIGQIEQLKIELMAEKKRCKKSQDLLANSYSTQAMRTERGAQDQGYSGASPSSSPSGNGVRRKVARSAASDDTIMITPQIPKQYHLSFDTPQSHRSPTPVGSDQLNHADDHLEPIPTAPLNDNSKQDLAALSIEQIPSGFLNDKSDQGSEALSTNELITDPSLIPNIDRCAVPDLAPSRPQLRRSTSASTMRMGIQTINNVDPIEDQLKHRNEIIQECIDIAVVDESLPILSEQDEIENGGAGIQEEVENRVGGVHYDRGQDYQHEEHIPDEDGLKIDKEFVDYKDDIITDYNKNDEYSSEDLDLERKYRSSHDEMIRNAIETDDLHMGREIDHRRVVKQRRPIHIGIDIPYGIGRDDDDDLATVINEYTGDDQSGGADHQLEMRWRNVMSNSCGVQCDVEQDQIIVHGGHDQAISNRAIQNWKQFMAFIALERRSKEGSKKAARSWRSSQEGFNSTIAVYGSAATSRTIEHQDRHWNPSAIQTRSRLAKSNMTTLGVIGDYGRPLNRHVFQLKIS